MSFFDKIKNLFESSSKESEKVLIEDLNIERLSDRIIKEFEIINSQKSEIKSRFNLLISSFNKDLIDVIKFLKNVDLSQRKEHEKIKSVVIQNLDYYIAHLEKFNSNLNNIHEQDFDSYIKRLVLIINSFSRDSHIHFERATILIGKELEHAREVVNSFMRDIKAIIEKQNPITQKEGLFNNLKIKNQELVEIKSLLNNCDKDLELIADNLKEKDKILDKTLEDIKLFKESEEFNKSLLDNEKNLFSLREVERNIQEIKRNIDIKLLAKTYHSDEKKSRLISDYHNNFLKALKDDKELKFFSLLESDNEKYCDKLLELREKLLDLENLPKTKAEITLAEMNDSLERLKLEISSLKSDIEEEKKKIDKIKANKEKITNDIKSLGLNLNLNIIE